MRTLTFLLLACVCTTALAADTRRQQLAGALVFHASFDETARADVASGDARIYTAANLQRKTMRSGLHAPGVTIETNLGRWGGALRFTRKTDQIVLYKAAGNMPFRQQGFQGSVSFWLSLDPDKDLEPGYADPIQITDKKWNDASFFVDFTKDDQPRHVRLGVFSDFSVWNPTNRKWEEVPPAERPMVDVAQPPFGRDRWTHVAWTFAHFNEENDPGVARFFLNGKLQGEINGAQRITWQPENAVIMLGLSYIGRMDDLAIFDRALTATEIHAITQLNGGIKTLRR